MELNVTLFRVINGVFRNSVLDAVLPVFSDKDYVVIPGIIVAIVTLFLGGRAARMCVLALIISLSISDLGSEKLWKNLFAEQRPYKTLENVWVYRAGEWQTYESFFDSRQSNSFPSSHAANAAAIAAAMAVFYRRSLWGTAPVAILVGWSRIYTGNHFPVDIVGAYVWGSLCGTAAGLACRKVFGESRGPARLAVPVGATSKERQAALWALSLWALFGFVYLVFLRSPLTGEEAIYWQWSRKLAFSYFGYPPGIAYLDGLMVGAGGNKEWALRTGSLLLSAGSAALVYALTLRLSRMERSALLAMVTFLSLPCFWFWSTLATPEAAFVFCWLLSMYMFHRAVRGEVRFWMWTGLALGLGFIFAFETWLLVVVFLAYIVAFERRVFSQRGPYLALSIALISYAIVVFSIHHSRGSGLAPVPELVVQGAGLDLSSQRLLHSLGFEFILCAPVLLGGLLSLRNTIAAKVIRSDAAYIGVCTALPLIYLVSGLLGFASHPATPLLAAASGCIALGWLPQWPLVRNPLSFCWLVGAALGLFATLDQTLHSVLLHRFVCGQSPLPHAGIIHDNCIELSDKREAREFGEVISRRLLESPRGSFFLTDKPVLGSLASFYAVGRPPVYLASKRTFIQMSNGAVVSPLGLLGRTGVMIIGGDSSAAKREIGNYVTLGLIAHGEVNDEKSIGKAQANRTKYTISRIEGPSISGESTVDKNNSNGSAP